MRRELTYREPKRLADGSSVQHAVARAHKRGLARRIARLGQVDDVLQRFGEGRCLRCTIRPVRRVSCNSVSARIGAPGGWTVMHDFKDFFKNS